MSMSIVSWILFFVCMLSLFIVPQGFWGSFDDYCTSIIVRLIASMIFIFVALFPVFGKSQIKRYTFFVLATVGISLGATMAWTYAEAKFGFIKTASVLGVLALISLVYIVFFEDRKNWRHRVKMLVLMR